MSATHPDRFAFTWFPAPQLRPGGDPNSSQGVYWPRFGTRRALTLRGLVELLTSPVAAPGKFQCPHYHCATLRDNLRQGDCFERASMVALDVEEGVTLAEAHHALQGCFHVLYTSWKHTQEAHRFRVVLPLLRPVDPTEYKALWAWCARRVGPGVDPQTRDLARANLLPAIRPDGRRAQVGTWGRAPLLDPDAVLEEALELVRPPPRSPPRPVEPVTLAPGDALREARLRLTTSPEARRRAALALGARVRSNRADNAPCPACGRRSVWFWLEPGACNTARCDHQRSCGWWGHLDELLSQAGAAHVS